MSGTTAGAMATVSETGYSNADVFKEYMETNFMRYINRSDIRQPVLLIFDGHTTNVALNDPLGQRKEHP